MFSILVLHLFLMIAGYFLAVFTAASVAGFIVVNVFAAFKMVSVFSVLFENWNHVVDQFSVALLITARFGFPGWLIAVTAAETLSVRRKYWFAVAGALNALLALVISGELPLWSPMFFHRLPDTFPTVVCGFFAGLAYWRLAGWRSGFWKGGQPGNTETTQAAGKYVTTVETIFTRLLRIYAGLGLGNLAGSTVCWLMVMGPRVEGGHHLLINHISNIVDLTGEFGAVAFYPAIVAFLYAEFKGRRTWLFHALGGMAVTLTIFLLISPHLLLPANSEDAATLFGTLFAFGACGAVNGLVYWLIAVSGAARNVANQLRSTSVSAGS